MKGSTGSNTNTIIYIKRKRKTTSCDCKQCKHGSKLNNKVYCNVTGSTKPVNRKKCLFYIGPYIKYYKHQINNKGEAYDNR